MGVLLRKLLSAVLGIVFLAAGLAPVAQAQYYSPGYYPPPRGGYYEDPGYRRRPPPPPEYYRPGPPQGYYAPHRDPYGFGPGYERRGNYSRICLTGRGPCAMEQYLPIGSGCRCKIDGLRKGGTVG